MRDHLGKRAGSLGSAVGMVFAAMASPAGATNLLINPGFESPIDNNLGYDGHTDTTVTGWTLYGDELRANYQNNTPGGQWSIWEQTFMPFGGVYQNVSGISANTPYTLSGWEYFEANYPTTGANGDLELTWFGPGTIGVNAAQVGTPAETFIDPNSVPTGVWTQYSVSNAMAPTGATQVQVSFDFTSTYQTGSFLAGFVDDADLEGAGIPPNAEEWAVNGDGNWNLPGNWTTGLVPNGAGAEADLYGAITSSPQTVYTDTAITLGTLHFNNSNEYVIAGAPTLTLQATTGNALVEVEQGTDELDLPVTIASNTVFNVASGASLIVANPLTIDAGKSLTQTGTGNVIYQSIITVNSGASITFADSTHAHELSLASGATATLGGPVLEVDSLSNLGTVNVKNDILLINYGSGPDPIASVKSQILQGYANGAWDGTGIMSTNAQTNSGSYGLAYADAADPGNPAGLAPGQIEVMYTLLGDANLDKKVNGTDFNILAANFNTGGDSWDQGDFTYDGKVNGSDFNIGERRRRCARE